MVIVLTPSLYNAVDLDIVMWPKFTVKVIRGKLLKVFCLTRQHLLIFIYIHIAFLQSGYAVTESKQFLTLNWFCHVSSKPQVWKSYHRISSGTSSWKYCLKAALAFHTILWCVSSVVICLTGKVTEEVIFLCEGEKGERTTNKTSRWKLQVF